MCVSGSVLLCECFLPDNVSKEKLAEAAGCVPLTDAQNGIHPTAPSQTDLFDLIWLPSICSSPCLCLIVFLPPLNCFYAFRCRNKSQKSKFDEELHNEMTTTIDELGSK